MTTRHVRNVIAGSLLTCGMVAIAPAISRAQVSTPDLPLKGQYITVVGCLINGAIEGHPDKLVLAKARMGTLESVPEATCTASDTDSVIRLQDMRQVGLNEGYAGRWMIIDGRLESQHKVHKDREIHVKSFRPVPVVVPRAAEVIAIPAPFVEAPTPAPPAAVAEVIIPEPVATAGVKKQLPKTATSLPLFGLIGFLSLAAGLGLRLVTRRSLAQG